MTADSVRLVAAARDACWATSAEPHTGGYVWKNGAELVWECADSCKHSSHDCRGDVTNSGSRSDGES